MESSPSATNWRTVAKLHRPNLHMLQSIQALAHGADTVQYFQFRKGRGGPEQFHGAIVDHEGSENTRVFKDVAEVGAYLKGLDGLAGADTPAKVALVYDYNVRWALDDAKGFLQEKTGYEQTVIEHYRPFWTRGIPVDIIDSKQSYDKYGVLIAPMLYMVREGVAGRIRAFVEKGGIFITTYTAGYVDETALAFLGGFPGPLKEILGIWSEEIDALFSGEQNTIEWTKDTRTRSYKAFDLCELIHARGAEVLGVYGGDFYAGRPALTVNVCGKGKAYFIAARTGSDFLRDFYQEITAEAGIKPVLACPLPEGVTAQIRSNGKENYIFLMNFSSKDVSVSTNGTVITLKPFEARIIVE
jgi:beta-galactosidase